MRLDRVSIALRARDPWEAVDLGAVMIRTWWRPIYATLLVLVVPIAVVSHLIMPSWPWAAVLLTWWLKPLYDRAVLHILARAVFGETPRVRETLSSLRQLLTQTALFKALTWRRFDTARAFNLSVYQLEGQRGATARSRERLLGRRTQGQTSGLFYACVLFELVIALSLSACVDLLTPAAMESEYGPRAFFRYLWNPDIPSWGVFVNNAFYLVAMCAIEPLYVGSGFALYLNRRTTLEAWDLELSFRAMAQRATGHAARGGGIAAALLIIGAGLMPHELHAASQPSKEIIREVLAAPEFQEYRQDKSWRPRTRGEPSSSPAWQRSIAQLLAELSRMLSELMRIGAYLLLAVGVYFLLRYLVRQLGTWKRERDVPGTGRITPDVLFGLDVRPEALPANLAQAAALVTLSDPRLALSLLYRGALATLIHRDRLALDDGDTEGDCLRRVERHSPSALAQYFGRLVNAWSQLAYGKHAPANGVIEALCEEWPRHFTSSEAGQ
jgi:hypothetical protein